jgi:hypothetical protein
MWWAIITLIGVYLMLEYAGAFDAVRERRREHRKAQREHRKAQRGMQKLQRLLQDMKYRDYMEQDKIEARQFPLFRWLEAHLSPRAYNRVHRVLRGGHRCVRCREKSGNPHMCGECWDYVQSVYQSMRENR